MSVHLSALAVRARFIATVATVLVAAMLLVTAPAEAADVSGTPVLAQGAGMAAKPSAGVRRGAAGAAASWLRPRRCGSRWSLRSDDRGCRPPPAGAARTGRRRRRGEAQRTARACRARRRSAAGARTPSGRRHRAPRARRRRAPRRVEADPRAGRGRRSRVAAHAAPETIATTPAGSSARAMRSPRSCVWAAFAAFAALAVAGLWRLVSRVPPPARGHDARARRTLAGMSADEAVDGLGRRRSGRVSR